mmetsp:Transcript_17715/g.62083  ORF Transcript_17715/g.62083 Transcript_17715/m.62083 type:complete len:257 (-) Transcript_17715:575-1345(-)
MNGLGSGGGGPSTTPVPEASVLKTPSADFFWDTEPEDRAGGENAAALGGGAGPLPAALTGAGAGADAGAGEPSSNSTALTWSTQVEVPAPCSSTRNRISVPSPETLSTVPRRPTFAPSVTSMVSPSTGPASALSFDGGGIPPLGIGGPFLPLPLPPVALPSVASAAAAAANAGAGAGAVAGSGDEEGAAVGSGILGAEGAGKLLSKALKSGLPSDNASGFAARTPWKVSALSMYSMHFRSASPSSTNLAPSCTEAK